MQLPIIASQISLGVGLWLVLSVALHKRGVLANLDEKTFETEDNFGWFILIQLKKFLNLLGHYAQIVRGWYYKAAQRSLHEVRLLALKLESFTTRWLHHVKTSKIKQETKEEPPEEPLTVDGIKSPESNPTMGENYFSVLREDSGHEKVQSKLEDLKNRDDK